MEHYQRDFETTQLPGNQHQWIEERRHAAFLSWQALGFPSRDVEDWKYSSTYSLSQKTFSFQTNSTTQFDATAWILPNTHTIIIHDGQVELSTLPNQVNVMALQDALSQDLPILKAHLGSCVDIHQHGLTALNTAMMSQGVLVHLAERAYCELPLHFIFINSIAGNVTHPRNLMVLEKGAQATVIETYVSPNGVETFTNAVSEIILAKHAHLIHYKQIQEGDAAHHIATVHAKVASEAQFESHSFALSGQFVRSDTNVALTESKAITRLNGLYVAANKEHVDHHTTIHHSVPNCQSFQDYRGIINDAAHAVFNGKVIVAKDAHKTNAEQMNKNILLSTQAMVDTKPQLEIFNDDVRCTHGATIGQMDPDALFYLQSRGIPVATARQLLLQAFVDDLITAVTCKPLQQHLRAALNEKCHFELAGDE